jgi:hypothetical protein
MRRGTWGKAGAVVRIRIQLRKLFDKEHGKVSLMIRIGTLPGHKNAWYFAASQLKLGAVLFVFSARSPKNNHHHLHHHGPVEAD